MNLIVKKSGSIADRTAYTPFCHILLFLAFLTAIVNMISCHPEHETCIPQNCPKETNYIYYTCCDDQCCQRWRIWVMPTLVASVAFTLGVFFAFCFQCR